MKAGKALDSRKAEIRVQFKDVPGDIFKCKNFQWLLFFREVSVIIYCCWKREGQAMQCRSVFWARMHCMGCWLTNLWFQGAFNLHKIMFCLKARIRDGMSLWWDCNHQRLCTWSLQYVTLNRILIFPVEGFSTRNAFSCNSKRGCGALSSTLNVVACSHWNSCWFVWWVSSHCFPNSIHLMFWLYHLEVCKGCCPHFDQVQVKICLTGEATWFGNESNTKWAGSVISTALSRCCYPWSLWTSNSGHVLPQWPHTIYTVVWFQYFPCTTLINSAIPLCSLPKFFCLWTYAISIPSPSPAIQQIFEGVQISWCF